MFAFRQCKTGIAVVAMLAASGPFAATGNKSDYNAVKDRIGAEYQTDKAACDGFSGNRKDVCLEQARGKEKVARAEAEFNYTGKVADLDKVAIVKADSGFAVAKEICDDKGGDEKNSCRTEAKANHDKALAEAKMTRRVGEARKDAADDRRDADYRVATEKCDTLAGDAKAACISAAKARFNKS